MTEVIYLIHDGENGNMDPNIETYFVFDNNLKDTDGDWLTDYQEITLSSTNPTKKILMEMV